MADDNIQITGNILGLSNIRSSGIVLYLGSSRFWFLSLSKIDWKGTKKKTWNVATAVQLLGFLAPAEHVEEQKGGRHPMFFFLFFKARATWLMAGHQEPPSTSSLRLNYLYK